MLARGGAFPESGGEDDFGHAEIEPFDFDPEAEAQGHADVTVGEPAPHDVADHESRSDTGGRDRTDQSGRDRTDQSGRDQADQAGHDQPGHNQAGDRDHPADPVEALFEVGLPPGSVIRQGDRLKAYRPIPPERRREALEAGLKAYERGDFFEAHELLEPAWMGTSELAEREMYQGLIKLAAGYVHCVRGNPIGMSRNLDGARRHLEEALKADSRAGDSAGIDVPNLVAEIDVRIRSVQVAVAHLNTNPAIMLELADAAPKVR